MSDDLEGSLAELLPVKHEFLQPQDADASEIAQSSAAEDRANDSDDENAENASPAYSSDLLSEDEVRFFIGLVRQWFRVTRDPKKPVKTCADIEQGLRNKKEGRGARHQLWALQMQCKFGKTFDPSMLRKKWDNLMRSYKKLFDKGMGPTSTEAKTKFKYWEDMNEFFELDPLKVEVSSGQPGFNEALPSASATEEPEAPDMPLSHVLFLISLAKKNCRNNDPTTIRVTADWVHSMEKEFGKSLRLPSLQAAWRKLLSTQETPSSSARLRKRTHSGTVKFFDQLEKLVRANATYTDETTNDEDTEESEEEVSDGDQDEDASVVARELIVAFQRESRKDRKLLRKMLTVFSKATGVAVDVETSDDE